MRLEPGTGGSGQKTDTTADGNDEYLPFFIGG
jgi:hypothetical protein